jgi:quercetin dioxygenase-like cupin family protein
MKINTFNIVSLPTYIKDRQVINVIPFNSQYTSTSLGFSKFVICCGSLKADAVSINERYSASILNTEFSITGNGVVIEMPGYLFTEQKFTIVNPTSPGNLSYIDGCSNSNLIDPPRNGDPCLNYLYFPKGINQTFHTHPSIRIGMVLAGSGIAEVDGLEIPLVPGVVFVLDRFSLHRFRTTDSYMSLIAFHPDSEDGPHDEHNPMKTRTYI